MTDSEHDELRRLRREIQLLYAYWPSGHFRTVNHATNGTSGFQVLDEDYRRGPAFETRKQAIRNAAGIPQDWP